MQKNELLKCGDTILRVLESSENHVFVIDCLALTMPKWIDACALDSFQVTSENELLEMSGMELSDVDVLDWISKRFIHEHYTLIAPILPIVADKQERKRMMNRISADTGTSTQTIRRYLVLYLAYQNKCALAPKYALQDGKLSADEKNMRWALNKYFYTAHKNSLNTAYTMMLKEKYCSVTGELHEVYPTFNQFRYFYRKHRSMQTFYISRNGLTNYQRNNRPLIGDGVQEYASNVGVGMVDSTICDIYLVDSAGCLVGRPLLTACIDAYSGLCCGYALSWEGGVYSLKGLLLNVIADKVEHCLKFGISIEHENWDCNVLPGVIISDKGSEYKSENFEQLAEVGVTIINLPSYRPELKGVVEKFFDLVQESYKPHLKGSGIIESDFQERGVHDYRKDACLTLTDFEKIILRCIIYHNSGRIMEGFPYTKDMLKEQVPPHAARIWDYGRNQAGANLIELEPSRLILTLLPRSSGKFTRYGLKVNGLRYKNDAYTEACLSGNVATVAFNPEDVSMVWLMEKGNYVPFDLIESRYSAMALSEVEDMRKQQRTIIASAETANLQARIDLANHIEAIARNTTAQSDTRIKSIRETRKKERTRTHRNYVQEGITND